MRHHQQPRDFREVLCEYAARNLPDFRPRQSAPCREGSRLLSPLDARNVLNDPLLSLPGTESDGAGGIKLRQGEIDPASCKPSLGQYRDFRQKPRSLPQLNAHTVKGILLQPGVLYEAQDPTEEFLRSVAKAASTYRRKQNVTGGDCGPESAELYIRIFRALGMSFADATARSAEQLGDLYLAYLVVHTIP